jgi:ATP-dependent RNA helicase SUPV3L1/SUV3
MAKKKKKYLIKLNNKIRNFFNGLPFDEGINTLEEEKLIELIMLLEINMPSHTREEMVRILRRVWSEEGAGTRELIVSYLTKGHKAVHSGKRETQADDKVGKILSILSTIEHSVQEENYILEAFIDAKHSKITPEKIKNKLYYMRLKNKLHTLEKSLDATFTSENEMEFYHRFTFRLKEVDFSKMLMCKTEAIELEMLDSTDESMLIERLHARKTKAIEKKEKEIETFCKTLNLCESHYLTQDELYATLKALHPDSPIDQAPIKFETVEKLLKNIHPTCHIFESQDHIVIEEEKHYDLFGTPLHYFTTLSYEKSFLYQRILHNLKIALNEELNHLNAQRIAEFKTACNEVLDEMRSSTEKLSVSQSTLESFIVRFVEPQVRSSRTLTLKEKSRRRILFHFADYIKPLREKQKREELLAKTIRDFKHLFPLARQLKRKIYFHVGPTNSGKTYAALKTLKEATTGYYLAPLRLLALEGYEKLKQEEIHASLITGEEEIIDEASTHISSTIEMMNISVDVDVCVIDEIQMISDRDRGWAWANALMGAPAKKVILTGSANALPAIEALCEYLGEPLEVIHFERKNELTVMPHAVNMKKIEPQTAIVAFSRRDVLGLKQQLSARYSVSVVYGNLSPEVRREEAKRFREGESQILVSTDAIAMGLNLPIKTLLFAKDNKFDGLRRRELLPTEVSQIAGRAGRYGFEEKGYVGALDEKTLRTIDATFHAPLPEIELPVSVMASLEHVMLIGEILETENITTILGFFAENMEFEGPFRAANIDSMLEIAAIVDEYQLDLKTRYYLSCAPASIGSPYIESVFHRYIKQIEAGGTVLYIPPRDLPAFAQTNDMLLNAEDRVREISLYLWLSFKFPDIFQDVEKALQSRVRLNSYIENSLRQGHFTKKCRKCGKVLDFSYKFSICDRCHTNNRRGYRSSKNEDFPREGYRRRRRR